MGRMKAGTGLILLIGWLPAAALPAAAQHRAIEIDAGKTIGPIRSFQGVNDGPAPLTAGTVDVSAQYREMRVDLVRVHDLFGPGDIDARWSHPDPIAKAVGASASRTIFPDPAADPSKESSYTFEPTDKAIHAITATGAEVLFRVGRSWSADPEPPADPARYAEIVKHVAMHYNAGWAHGFHDNIRYWEIWNEPDLKKEWFPAFIQPFWTGTPEQYYTLYDKVSRALKSFDPNLKVGGPAKAAPALADPYREEFMRTCVKRRLPLDFYSWHIYSDASHDPYDIARMGKKIRELLDQNGLKETESIVTEWGMTALPGSQKPVDIAVFLAAAMRYLQDSSIARATYYRGDATSMGLFNNDGSWRSSGRVFKAIGSMTGLERMPVKGDDTYGFAVLAGLDPNPKKNRIWVHLTNYEIPPQFRNPLPAGLPHPALDRQPGIAYSDNRGYTLTLRNIPWSGAWFAVRLYRVTDGLTETVFEERSKGGHYTLDRDLPPNADDLLELERLPEH